MATDRPPARRAPDAAGAGRLVRLQLRQERWALPAWVAVLVLTAVSTVSAIRGLYPGAAERAALAAGIAADPSLVVLTGRVATTSVGGLTSWRLGVLLSVAAGVMGLVTVVRRTRGDEDAGRGDLLVAAGAGRAAATVAALAVAGAAALAVGLLTAAGLVSQGLPVTGAVGLAGSVAGSALVFAGVAAVTGQLSGSGRAAVGSAVTVLAACFALRALADTVAGLGWLNQVSPLGWPAVVQPFGADRWWDLVRYPATAAVLALVAVAVSRRRDVGVGLLPPRPGPAGTRVLAGRWSLSLRLLRGPGVGTVVGMAALGALAGSVGADPAGLLQSTPAVEDLLRRIGGPGGLVPAYLATMGAMVGLFVAAQAVAAVLALRREETAGRWSLLLPQPLSRVRMLVLHLAAALLWSALALAAGGASMGAVLAGRTGRGGLLGDALAATVVQFPAVLVMAAVAALLVGAMPVASGAAWLAWGAAVVLGQLGGLLQLPGWVTGLSPFAHVPRLPAVAMSWTGPIGLLVLAVAVVVLAAVGLRRRDAG
ncbi:exporter of polyketide antibiotics [Nakamurella endophytica]|uniref:Exporter of polyketide antibiotics n=1 Tax=Nakamurella endophytica TaxID=1748367 RepID=A0A917WBK5_9ACTN|nr:exporter of polyketide antibiotics [Nakamurella endophytica]